MCIFGLVRIRQQGWKVDVSAGQVVDKDYVSYVRSCFINLSSNNREKIIMNIIRNQARACAFILAALATGANAASVTVTGPASVTPGSSF